MQAGAKVIVECLLLIIFVFGSAAQPGPKDEQTAKQSAKKEGLTLVVDVPKKSRAGDPLSLRCVVENQSKESVYYFALTGNDIFTIEAVDSQGKRVPLTRFGKMNSTERPGSWVLNEILPGKKTELVVPISRLCDLSLSDTYKVKIRINLEDKVDHLIELVIDGITVTVEESKK